MVSSRLRTALTTLRETRLHGISNVAAAAPLRVAPAEYPRRGRGVAATRLHGMSASQPRRRCESSRRNIHVATAALPRRKDPEQQPEPQGATTETTQQFFPYQRTVNAARNRHY